MAIGIPLAPDINATGLNYSFFQFFLSPRTNVITTSLSLQP